MILAYIKQFNTLIWHFTKKHGLALIVFTAVYLMITWPLGRHLTTHLQGSYKADAWEEVEQFWWYKHAVIDLGVSPFYDPDIFYPEGWNTVTGSHSPTLMLPTIPITMVLGPVGAFNILMLATFLFAALGNYFLVNRLTGSRLAGVVAGVIFGFSMSRLLRIGGHFNTATGSAWIPWVFLCLESARLSKNGRQRTSWYLGAGASYAGSVLSYFYFVYILAIPMAAYFLYEIWQSRLDKEQIKIIVGGSLLAFGIASLLVAPFAFMALLARNEVGIMSYSLEATAPLVISPDRLFLPNRYHPLWGAWLRNRFSDVGEQTFVFLGLTASFLAITALVKRFYNRTGMYLFLALIALILGMGPYLYWNTTPVTIPLSGYEHSVRIPLPGLLFFQYAPMFNVIRVWARFFFVISMSVATLAGMTVAALDNKYRWGRLISILLLVLVIFESFGHPFNLVSKTDMIREVDKWLAAQPEQFAIMELPLNDRLNGSLMYSHVIHQKPMSTGYATAMPRFFLDQVAKFTAFPNQKTVNILSEWNVRYLLYNVTNTDVFELETAPSIQQLNGLTYVGTFGGYPGETVYVYIVNAQ